MPGRSLEDAVIRLLRDRPFYGNFLVSLRRAPLAGDQPLGITIRGGVPTLCVNEPLFATLDHRHQQALLEHCIHHLLRLHMVRRKGRNVRLWDDACDIAINPYIDGMPGEAPRPERYRLPPELAAEEYYDLLAARPDTGNLEGYGLGDGERDTGNHADRGNSPQLQRERADATADDHRVWQDADGTPLRLAEEMVRSLARDALRLSDGDLPGEVRTVVDGLLAPAPIPWRQVLRQFIGTAGRTGRRTTWSRSHRRFGQETPGIRKRQLLNLLVGVDVSESTDSVPLRKAFARELVSISRGREARITVLYANSRVQRIDSFTGPAVEIASYHGGGFTDLRPVFDHARTMQPPPAAVVYLTDGRGEAPPAMEFPTLWVLTGDGEKPAPWGVELRLTEESCSS
jgi:predicted metal-dependent peptidase